MFAYPINPLDVSVSDGIEEVKILRELCDILDVYGQKYWLDSGTLLGAFREGKILGHDADIDICCLVNHDDFWWSRKQVKLLNLISSCIHRVSSIKNNSSWLSLISKYFFSNFITGGIVFVYVLIISMHPLCK